MIGYSEVLGDTLTPSFPPLPSVLNLCDTVRSWYHGEIGMGSRTSSKRVSIQSYTHRVDKAVKSNCGGVNLRSISTHSKQETYRVRISGEGDR